MTTETEAAPAVQLPVSIFAQCRLEAAFPGQRVNAKARRVTHSRGRTPRRVTGEFIVKGGGAFGSVVAFERPTPYGWALVLRVAPRTHADSLTCDGPLRMSSLRLFAPRGHEVRFLVEWSGSSSHGSRTSVELLQQTDDFHEIREGSMQTWVLAIVKPDVSDFDPQTALYDELGWNEQRESGLEHELYCVSDRALSHAGLGWDAGRTVQMARECRAGLGMLGHVPYGPQEGARAGGDALGFTPWEEVSCYTSARHYCLLMALRQESRQDTIAIGGDDHRPILPGDVPSLFDYDSGAGVGDASRLPHLQSWDHAFFNQGVSTSGQKARKYQQHDDEHLPRALRGLVGLLEYVPHDSPIWGWAYETYLGRAAMVWHEIPDRPARGTNLPGMIVKGHQTAWWDRDEGWTLAAAATLDHYSRTHAQRGGPFGWRTVTIDVRHWHGTWRQAFQHAVLPNGMLQAVGKGEKAWNTDPFTLHEPTATRISEALKCAYSFQASIMSCAAWLSDTVWDRWETVLPDELLDSHVHAAAEFLAGFWQASREFEHNGGKTGPANVVPTRFVTGEPVMSVDHLRKERIGITEGERGFGFGDVVNPLPLYAVCEDTPRVLAMLGVFTEADVKSGAPIGPDEIAHAIAVIRADTAAGYSGHLDWSALALQHLYERLTMIGRGPTPADLETGEVQGPEDPNEDVPWVEPVPEETMYLWVDRRLLRDLELQAIGLQKTLEDLLEPATRPGVMPAVYALVAKASRLQNTGPIAGFDAGTRLRASRAVLEDYGARLLGRPLNARELANLNAGLGAYPDTIFDLEESGRIMREVNRHLQPTLELVDGNAELPIFEFDVHLVESFRKYEALRGRPMTEAEKSYAARQIAAMVRDVARRIEDAAAASDEEPAAG